MESEIITALIKLGAAGVLAATLVVVVRLYYGDLKGRITAMDSKIKELETRCDQLENHNTGLKTENATLKQRLESCPVDNCYWKLRRQRQDPPTWQAQG